ncbi:MAG: molecular chaperone TorD family protein [Chloroflexi bacterium]|nr:molecular chaperone TorD family protein [Chloroflexota bacterium]
MQLELRTAEAQQTGSRSALFGLLARGFAFPSESLYDEIKGGRFLAGLQGAAQDLPYAVEITGPMGKGFDLTHEAFLSGYIALFEIGGPEGPPVPLFEGHYGGGLLRDMEEVLRLYHHFGFSYRGDFRPDHLQTELEFMHALTFGEAAACQGRGEPAPYRSAQRDFLHCHLKELAYRVAAGLQGRKAPFYGELARLLAAFVEKEYALSSSRQRA